MNVLLSIKPKFVESILNGEKRYEFRKVIFKKKSVEKVYIYSSSPVKKIVGTFIVGDIIEDHPREIWERCHKESGIDEVQFFNYFNGRKKGFAIAIEYLEPMDEPIDPRNLFPDFVAPQSFCYFEISSVGGPCDA